jgi:hypothetical protein
MLRPSLNLERWPLTGLSNLAGACLSRAQTQPVGAVVADIGHRLQAQAH